MKETVDYLGKFRESVVGENGCEYGVIENHSGASVRRYNSRN